MSADWFGKLDLARKVECKCPGRQSASWAAHVGAVVNKCNQRLFFFSQLKHSDVQHTGLLALYKSIIEPVLEYASPVWFSSLPSYLMNNLERIQKRAL